MRGSFAALTVILAVTSKAASADFLGSISSGLNTATNAINSGLNTASNAVNTGVSTAVNATTNGLNIATNATEKGLNVALNKSSEFINTAESSIKDVYNVSKNTVETFTDNVQSALAPAASTLTRTVDTLADSVYNVTTSSYKGLVSYGRSATGQAPAAQTTPTESTTVDATNATSILQAISTNSSGFVPLSNSILVALGQLKSAGVESGIRNVVNNSTGNNSYPTSGTNETVSLGLAQAVVTALVTANNYSVTVDFEGRTNSVNASQVVDAFLAGLQDGLTPCARNVTSSSNETAGSEAYFANIASKCCYLVSQPLTYASVLSNANGVGEEFLDGLERSQLLGQSPSLDLTRCLTNQTSTA